MSAAVLSIIILGICVVLFVTEVIPILTTAMLGCTAMVVLKVCTFAQGFGSFASDTVFLVLGVITLGNAMFEVGAAQLLGRGIIKVAGSNERTLVAVSMAVAAVLSAFLANTATVAMFTALFTGLVATNPHLKMKNLLMPIGLAAVAGGVCTLVGSTPQVVAQGILVKQLGKGFTMFEFTPVGAPIVVAMILFVYFIGYPMGKKIWGDRVKNEGSTIPAAAASLDEGAQPEQVNMRKVGTVLVIFGLTIAGFISGTFSLGTTCMMSALACILTGCISQKTALEKMDWVSVGVLGGALGIASGLDVSGGGKMIANGFIGLVGADASPFIIFAAICFITMALTQFMSNTASVAMLVPIAIFICKDMGMNPYAFAMGIVVAANMSFATPVATTPLTMTLVAGYRFMDYVKIGGAFNIICYFLVIALVPIFFPLIL
jgi:anion transporter